MIDKINVKKVMTFKAGKFVFSDCFGSEKISTARIEARVLYQSIVELPVLPAWSAWLDEELMIRSIFGTAAIEGNPLKEEDVAKLLSEPTSKKTTAMAEKEIFNLKEAYDFVAEVESSSSGFEITEEMIKKAHKIITNDIDYKNNLPGQYRNELVKVGNTEHGGVYTPPKVLDDIRNLMTEFIGWINSSKIIEREPFERAALAHYHLALIHPFSDGNGRTARLIEALLLNTAGVKYLPKMLSNYYYRNVDDYYWAFSKSIKNKSDDISGFIEFFLEAVVDSLKEMKKAIIFHIRRLTLLDFVAFLRKKKDISQRQHDLLLLLYERPESFAFTDLFEKARFRLLYGKVSQRTAQRDLEKLVAKRLLEKKDKVFMLNYSVLG